VRLTNDHSMIHLSLEGARRILCLGAHSDDIEIGCGGTLLTLSQRHTDLEILWVVFSGEGARTREARQSAQRFLKSFAVRKIVVKSFDGSFFPYQGVAIKKYFEQLKSFEPDLVFTHYRNDRHQDHRVLSDLAWNTFRNHAILEYEIPKYDGDLGIPNVFVPLDPEVVKTKTELVCKAFQTQRNKHWFSEDTFLSLMRLRGIECASQYAEAFHGRKLVVS
jgi:LmbE family N-acetylglucosaminyl deacetylase